MVLSRHSGDAGSALGVRSSRIEEEERRQARVTKIKVKKNPFLPDNPTEVFPWDEDPEKEIWVPQNED